MLPFNVKLGYGFGHVLNDLCSAVWFSYLLLYFHHVLSFPNTLSGLILLIGQVADAIATPFIGHEADRQDDLQFCLKYGRRKTWHLVGTVCVVFTFPFIFFGCLGCETANYWSQIFYFAPFVILFQFGWASTQISHLALLPILSSDPNDRTELNAIRYAFTVIATITVYCITWLVIGLNTTVPQDILGPSAKLEFIMVSVTIVVIGIVFSVGFHLMIKESNCPDEHDELQDSSEFVPMVWQNWLYEPQMYQVALLYMATRLFCNLSQAYIPLYVQDTLILNADSIAYIPLVMYVAGLLTTMVMKPANRVVGRKVTFLIGSFLSLLGAVWIYYGKGPFYCHYSVYIVAVILGSGSSVMLVTSLSITADLIGDNVECGAFVYGLMSFTDKLSNGLVVMLIQYLTPYMWQFSGSNSYFRYVIFYACGGSAVLAIVAILSLFPVKIGERRTKVVSRSRIHRFSENDLDEKSYPGGYTTVPQSEIEEPHVNNASEEADTHHVAI